MTDASPFDIRGPIPGPGVTVLEASAGTGKTFTIAALVARLVAEGIPIESILAVTFTRAATGELRDRVRSRLVTAEDALRRLLVHSAAPDPSDQVVAALADGEASVVEFRRQRLARALANFDAATIVTTHGFCQLALTGLGLAGRVGLGAELVEDTREMVDDVVDDLYVLKALHWSVPPFDVRPARAVARAAVANPATRLLPEEGDSVAGRQRRLAESARAEVERRLREADLLTYDDLLVKLREALADSDWGETTCARLRARYQAVLVDEFQDTDPVQWDVVQRAFGMGATRLVLIGDPKQAIYAFRGADVYAYLDASAQADAHFTLDVNWRADDTLLRGLDALLQPLRLGHPDIAYRPVEAAPGHQGPGLVGPGVGAPVRVRVLHADDFPGLPRNNFGVPKDAAVQWVADDLAADVARLLASRPTLTGPDGDRPLAPGDVAVLVPKNKLAVAVQEALEAVGIPSVLSGAGSVFSTGAALEWLRLLEALEEPASRSRAAAAALTPFLGRTVAELAADDDSVWEALHATLHAWSERLRRHGVASLARAVLAGGTAARLLATHDGERHLTDLTHVGQLLHAENDADQQGATALRAWLARRVASSDTETADLDRRSRRLESDADRVQVYTIHRAKGLEFPVVYVPFAFDGALGGGDTAPAVFHDGQGTRLLDVGIAGPDFHEHSLTAETEARGEALRLLYVALTRARHQTVLWWARVKDCQHSPLGRLVLARDGDGNVGERGGKAPSDQDMHARLEEIASRARGLFAVERAEPADRVEWNPPAVSSAPLTAAHLDRSLDRSWRRTSYTAMTAAAHAERVSSEPDDPGVQDEPERPAPAETAPDDPGLTAVTCPLADMRGGADVGTFVHRVLERVDFAAPDLGAHLAETLALERHRRPAGVEADVVAAGLHAALSTPLGPLAPGLRLSDVERGDRLDEMAFELPVGGGDRPTGTVSPAAVARLLRRHLGADDPLSAYPERLEDPALAGRVRGYLTGSLDLVVRLGRGDDARFLVADYKTNRLAREGGPLTAWHYRPAALAEEMMRAHYPLQALFYCVALHRYLRWRIAGYDPGRHLAGVAYLFLRGMVGPDTPVVDGSPCGVFSWRPPAALVTGLSDLLDQGGAS